MLEAGSDVFPTDPRPLAFAVDARVLEGSVRAVIAAPGSLCGVVLRRTSPRDFYAAVFDREQSSLKLVRRNGTALVTLAQTPALILGGDLTLELTAAGSSPTALKATLRAGGAVFQTTATDGRRELQQPGDPGVLGQARTLFPSAGPSAFPALGNLHLLPYGVQEGQAFVESPAGRQIVGAIRRESTVGFRQITIASAETPRPTPASVIAATTGVPRAGGTRLHVAGDLSGRVVIETADTSGFDRPRRLGEAITGAFDAVTIDARGLPFGKRAYWRATLHRAGVAQPGPVRSFPVLPAGGDAGRTRIAIGSCGAQFGPLFDDLARADPDVFIWQGDLNYPTPSGRSPRR